MIYLLTVLVFCVLCGILWRMGGSSDYRSAYRSIGSALCLLAVTVPWNNSLVVNCIVAVMVAWGCISYFGWVNYIVEKFWKDIEMEREYWWNFFAENLMIQSSALVIKCDPLSVVLAIVFALATAFGKTWIDADEDGVYHVLGFDIGEDVASEWFHGFMNCLFLAINVVV